MKWYIIGDGFGWSPIDELCSDEEGLIPVFMGHGGIG
jgi:hypothetical protein